MRKRLILVGIDGATWRIIAPLVSEGELPQFSKLISKSFVNILQSTVPAESPPAWTSMFTGVNPGKHGIVDFLIREGNGFVPCLSRYRMCPTIWRILSESGLHCIIINDPLTYPPEPVNGIMTTGLMTPPGSTDWIYPKELKNQINAVAGGYLCDIPPDFHSMLLNRRKRALDILKKMTSKSFRVSRYAASKCDWDLLAVIFTATDRLQHFWWREPLEITKHFRTLDSMLAEYVEYANSLSADLVIVSDHGFGPCDKHFMINEWLEKFGLASYRESSVFRALSEAGFTKSWIEKLTGRWPPVFSMLPAFLQDIIRRSIPESRESKRELDIARSVAYARSPAGIFVRGADWQDTIITKLREVTDHATGSLIFDSVMKRNDVMQGQYSYRAADLLLQPTLGYDVSVATRAFDSQLVGTHRPEGIFIHYRPGSIVSYEKENMPIRPWDVPAIILHVLDVPIPGYFDGRSKITGG